MRKDSRALQLLSPNFLHVWKVKTKLYSCLLTVLWDLNHLSRPSFSHIFFLLHLFHHPLQKRQWILLFYLFPTANFCLIHCLIINWVSARLTNAIHFSNRWLVVVLIHQVRILLLIFQNLFMSHSLHLQVFLVFAVIVDFFVHVIDVLFLDRVEYLWQGLIVRKALVICVLFHNKRVQFRRVHFLYNFEVLQHWWADDIVLKTVFHVNHHTALHQTRVNKNLFNLLVFGLALVALFNYNEFQKFHHLQLLWLGLKSCTVPVLWCKFLTNFKLDQLWEYYWTVFQLGQK
jgi:hypothetical protein